jgi:hypothetical protein
MLIRLDPTAMQMLAGLDGGCMAVILASLSANCIRALCGFDRKLIVWRLIP